MPSLSERLNRQSKAAGVGIGVLFLLLAFGAGLVAWAVSGESAGLFGSAVVGGVGLWWAGLGSWAIWKSCSGSEPGARPDTTLPRGPATSAEPFPEARRAVVLWRYETEDGREYRVDVREGEDRQRIGSSGRMVAARRLAKRVARQGGLQLVDRSMGKVRVHLPEELDLTLGERIRRQGKRPAPPARPGILAPFEGDGTPGTRLTLPGQRVPVGVFPFALVAAAAIALPAWFLATRPVGQLFAAATAGMTAVFLWRVAIAARPKVLVVRPEGVELLTLGGRQFARYAEIGELVTEGDVVHLLGDRVHLPLPCIEPGIASYVAAVIEEAASRDLTPEQRCESQRTWTAGRPR